MTVSLPMYDLGAAARANDALAEALGLGPLTRGPVDALWSDPGLVLSQICGYPFARSRDLHVVAVPRYDIEGCTPGHHRSFIIVNSTSSHSTLADLAGRAAVINEAHSVTGRHLLGDALGAARVRVGRVLTSGSHAASLASVARGEAEVAAIDCISLHHLRREAPSDVARVRVLAATRATPCPPFVTRAGDPRRLRDALAMALAGRAVATRALALVGFHEGPVGYAVTLDYAARADAAFAGVPLSE